MYQYTNATRNNYTQCVSECQPDAKFSLPNKTCVPKCMLHSYSYHQKLQCTEAFKNTYYWPIKDNVTAVKCSYEACETYVDKNGGCECYDFSNILKIAFLYVLLPLVCAFVLAIALCILIDRCKKRKRTKKMVEVQRDTYTTPDTKKNDQ